MLKLDNENFNEEVINSDKPVLVDFWASWCPPCRALTPLIHKLAVDYIETVKIASVNTDENPELAHAYDIKALPTLVFFKNGRPTKKMVGVQSEHVLRENLDNL